MSHTILPPVFSPQNELIYDFGYEVADPETGNFQNRAELKQSNGDVYGSYSYLLPTREILTVIYNVIGDQGFRYTMTRTPVDEAFATGVDAGVGL